MKSFILLKKFYRFGGVLQYDSSQCGRIITILINCIYYGICIMLFLSTFWYFSFGTRTFSEYVECSYFFVSSLLMASWYSVYLWQRNEYVDLISKLDAIIEERSANPIANTIYRSTNVKVEKLTSLSFMLMTQMLVPFFTISHTAIPIVKYITSGYSRDAFELMYPATYPFDWHTPAGFLVCAGSQASTVFARGQIIICSLSLVAGFSLFMSEFVSDLEEILRNIDKDLGTEKNGDSTMIRNKFYSFIQFDSQAKQFINRFSHVNSGIIFLYLVFAVVSISSLLLQIHISLTEKNYFGILQVLIPTTANMSCLYVFCHFGNKVTQRFLDIANAVYALSWYELPMDLQKNMPMMVAISQQSIFLRGFAGTQCTLEVFMKILKNVLSYFFVLREFAS